MRSIFTTFIAIICFGSISAQVQPNWESINARPYPQWFSDAKLGIFIHWGLYSVPAYSGPEQYAEWFYRGFTSEDTARINFVKKNYGENFKYEEFAPLFKAELFNPDEWATLFKNAGAQYVLLVTKHHDGYCLWDSKYQPHFNSVVTGPKRNIVGELTQSVRKQGLKMGFYYSLPEWTNPLHIWYQDPHDSIGRYVNEYMIPQFKELISTYKPTVLFTDGEWFNTAEQWHATELISWYYNTVGPDAIVNDRWGNGSDHGFKTPEYSSGILDTTRPWAECRGLGRSFGLNRNEPLSNYVTSEELIQHFVKLVASGGGMTLNVGPAADGQIPLLQQERLLDLGKWLEINGEAIYGTRPYLKFYETKEFTLSRIDTTINFDWVRNAPDKKLTYDHFNIVWNALLTVPISGNYTFEAEADDIMTLIINGKVVFSNKDSLITNTDSQVQEANTAKSLMGTIYLDKKGNYEMEVLFEEHTHQATAKLFWTLPNQDQKEIIKPQYLQHFNKKNNSCALDVKGFDATYTCSKPYVVYTTKPGKLYAIALEYPDTELILEIPKPKKGTQIHLLGRSGSPLPWSYKNGKLIIDTSQIHYSEIKSKGAWCFVISD
jgi:alpha-L-fucosidase